MAQSSYENWFDELQEKLKRSQMRALGGAAQQNEAVQSREIAEPSGSLDRKTVENSEEKSGDNVANSTSSIDKSKVVTRFPKRKVVAKKKDEINELEPASDSQVKKVAQRNSKKRKKPTSEAQREMMREKQRRYRERIRTDPEKYEAAKANERARNEKRKKEGKLKPINEKSQREQRLQRKMWKKNSQNFRKRKANNERIGKFIEDNSPPPSPHNLSEDQLFKPSNSNSKNPTPRQVAGKKRLRKARAEEKRKIENLKRELINANKRAELWKKICQRNFDQSNEKKNSPTPRKKVKSILRSGQEKIRRELIFGETLKKQLKQNIQNCKTQEDREKAAELVSGETIKKYKQQSKLQKEGITTAYYQRKVIKMKTYNHTERRRQRVSRVRKIESLVRDFYLNDENSTMSPGKKDVISSQKRSKKAIKRQKRFLNDSLYRLHQKFLKQVPFKIGYVTFVKLKPFWVIDRKITGRDTCLCVKCENMKIKLRQLHQLKLTDVISTQQLLEKVTCNANKYECMYALCGRCKSKSLPSCDEEANVKTSFHEWQTVKVSKRNKKGKTIEPKVTTKQKIFTDANGLIKALNADLPDFCIHKFNVYHQHISFSELKKNLQVHEAAIFIDFSENYACKHTSEVQSFHFGGSRKQITLHTGVIYFSPQLKNIKTTFPFCTVSEDLRHSAEAIWAHLQPIITQAKILNPALTTIHFFSDSTSAQYRNKVNFWLFTKKCEQFQLDMAMWNFSESGHGKNSADGIGGVVKRTADHTVAQNTDIINADTFLESVKHVKVFFSLIKKEEIDEVKSLVPFPNLQAIKGTFKVHQVIWKKATPSEIGVRILSCQYCLSDLKCNLVVGRSRPWIWCHQVGV